MKKGTDDEPWIKVRWLICFVSCCVYFAFTTTRVTLTLSLVALANHKTIAVHSNGTSPLTVSLTENATSVANLSVLDPGGPEIDEGSPIVLGPNETLRDNFVNWTPSTNDLLFEIVFFGGLISPLPAGRLAERIGPKTIVISLLLANGTVLLLFPVTVCWSFYVASALLFIKGMFSSPLFCCASVLVSRWSPACEKTMFVSALHTGSLMAILTVNPLVGYLCSLEFLGGWPLAFYIVGCLDLLIGLIYFLVVTNDPEDHPFITETERDLIVKERSALREGHSVPWGKILTSAPVWALIISHFALTWLSSLIAYQIPEFFKDILGVSIKQNGLLSALPYAGSFVSLVFFSYTVDKLRSTGRFSITMIRKVTTDLGFIVASGFLVLSTTCGINLRYVVICMIISKAFADAITAGCYSAHLDLTPTFAGSLGGILETVHNFASMAMSHTAFHLIGDEPTPDHWLNLFLVTAGVCFMGTHYFALLGSCDLQEWDPEFNNRRSEAVSPEPNDLVPIRKLTGQMIDSDAVIFDLRSNLKPCQR